MAATDTAAPDAVVNALRGQRDVLLELLRQAHGVINAMYIDDLDGESAEQMCRLARQMRQAIDDTDLMRLRGR